MTLAEDISRVHRAGFGGIRVVTRDEEAFVSEVKPMLLNIAVGGLFSWSCASGLWRHSAKGLTRAGEQMRDPFEFTLGLRALFDEEKQPVTILLFGLDEFIEKDQVVRRALVEGIRYARTKGHLLCIVSGSEHVHRELRDECSVLLHELPTREQSSVELTRLMTKYTVAGETEGTLDAAQGLTFSRQKDAFGLALIDAKDAKRAIDAKVVRTYKEKEVGKKSFLKIEQPKIGFSDLIGHEYLKQWLKERRIALTPAAREAGLPSPRGVLFVGPPGTGKTRLVEATANEWQVPWLTLDAGGLYGSLLGESEARLAEALEIAERMAPCLLLLDEVERGFGNGGGDRDGGTQERVLGKLLTWMGSKTAPVFVVMTSNFAERLPAALIRKGRVDEIFCLDLPSDEERLAVFRHYLTKAEPHAVNTRDLGPAAIMTRGWVPSEIEAAVSSARFTAFAASRQLQLFDLMSEIEKTVPVSRSMAVQVENMRVWAKHFARQTSYVEESSADGERMLQS